MQLVAFLTGGILWPVISASMEHWENQAACGCSVFMFAVNLFLSENNYKLKLVIKKKEASTGHIYVALFFCLTFLSNMQIPLLRTHPQTHT